MKIAQRFIAGKEIENPFQVPQGTAEIVWQLQPSLAGLLSNINPIPSDKSLGYYPSVPDGTKRRCLDIRVVILADDGLMFEAMTKQLNLRLCIIATHTL